VQPHKWEVACRVVLWSYVGPPPNANMMCMHICDNPRCLNPLHLYWGTMRQNVVGGLETYEDMMLQASPSRGGMIERGLPNGAPVVWPQ
jgi:hypothetical protein